MILRQDYEKVLRDGSISTYHEMVAEHLESLVNQNSPEIQIVDQFPAQKCNSEPVASRESILQLAEDDEGFAVDIYDPIRLTCDAYGEWIGHNERRLKFLRPDEKLAKELRSELIPAWREQRQGLEDLLSLDRSKSLDEFRKNDQWMFTFGSLLQAAAECIRMADAGLHVYDPMLVEYLPIIQFLERIRVMALHGNQTEDISAIFTAYSYRMSRYGEPVPMNFSIKDIPRLFGIYASVREKLARVDTVLSEVSEEDPSEAFEAARREIQPLVAAAQEAAKKVEYGFWAVGLFSLLASILASPDLTKKAKELAGALTLIERNVGQFAGAFAVIADAMVTHQRHYFWSRGFMGYEAYRRTFWDPGKMNSIR